MVGQFVAAVRRVRRSRCNLGCSVNIKNEHIFHEALALFDEALTEHEHQSAEAPS